MRRTQPPPKAVLVERDGRFYFFDPNFNVIASGSTVDQAYEKFNDVWASRASEIDGAGFDLRTNAGRGDGAVQRQSVGRELALFTTKVCIALVIVAVVGLPVVAGIARGVSSALSQMVASVKPISLTDISTKAADIARDAKNLSPEKKETLRQSVAVIKRELAPVIDAWVNPPDTQPVENR